MKRKSNLRLITPADSRDEIHEIQKFRTEPRAVPFITTKAGIRIGSAYERPAPRPFREDEMIQKALLIRPVSSPYHAETWIAKVLETFWRWL